MALTCFSCQLAFMFGPTHRWCNALKSTYPLACSTNLQRLFGSYSFDCRPLRKEAPISDWKRKYFTYIVSSTEFWYVYRRDRGANCRAADWLKDGSVLGPGRLTLPLFWKKGWCHKTFWTLWRSGKHTTILCLNFCAFFWPVTWRCFVAAKKAILKATRRVEQRSAVMLC